MTDRLGNNLLKRQPCEADTRSCLDQEWKAKVEEVTAPRAQACPSSPEIETHLDCQLEETVFTFNAAEYKSKRTAAPEQDVSSDQSLSQDCASTRELRKAQAQGNLTIKSLNKRRYSGSVLDKLISWLADVIKIFELRMLGRLYSRYQAKMQTKIGKQRPERTREEQEAIYLRARRRRNKHRYPF